VDNTHDDGGTCNYEVGMHRAPSGSIVSQSQAIIVEHCSIMWVGAAAPFDNVCVRV
jgi:hypothetical protein